MMLHDATRLLREASPPAPRPPPRNNSQTMQAVPDLSALFDGVPDGGLSVGEGGSVRPWRLPVADLDLFVPTQGNAHHASSSNGILVQAANSSGVRIVLSSDTDRLRMVVQPRFVYSGAVFDLVADNVLLSTQACPPEKTYTPDPSLDQMTAMQEMFKQMQEWSALDAQPLTVEFEGIAAAGAERLELWLPHRATVTILSLEVAPGAAVAPVKDLRPRWITHGSSITHCAEAHSPARTWPATAARLADVRLYSLGFGGQCHFDQAVARVIRDEPADCISLKYALASASYILPNLSLKGDLSDRVPHGPQAWDQHAQPRVALQPHLCHRRAGLRTHRPRRPPDDAARAHLADLRQLARGDSGRRKQRGGDAPAWCRGVAGAPPASCP